MTQGPDRRPRTAGPAPRSRASASVSPASIRVIVPTLNAADDLDRLLPALAAQTGLIRDQVLAIDSASTDGTPQRLRAWGAQVIDIARADFDHGATRAMAAAHCADADILIYMTQDAIPADPHTLSNLLAAFEDPHVAVAYGRQLPRPQAGQIERHARLRNYPDRSDRRVLADAPRLGLRTCFTSNSFAAYRHDALRAIGSFARPAFFAEDQIAAARLLIAGHALAYRADAQVIHSHGYGLRAEAARYFDIGVFHARSPWLLDTFGGAEQAGGGFVTSEIAYLLRHAPLRLPEAALRTVLKYASYRLGRAEARLPRPLKAWLSQQPAQWTRDP